MIIARDPTAKVCLTSLFFWIPGRGSVLINARHVFFSMLVFQLIFFSFCFYFISGFWNMSVGPWCVMRYLWCRPIVFIWYIYALCSREWCFQCIFLIVEAVSGRWRGIMDHRLFWITDCWHYLCGWIGASGTSSRLTATSLARVVCMEINSGGELWVVQIILLLFSLDC